MNFSELTKKNKTYAGANGNKISVVYQDELYMLKFAPHARWNKEMSYANSCFSEYLGCHVFESVGIPVQKTMLGTYTNRDMEKIVVACRDFTSPGIILQDFGSLKNQMIDSEKCGYGTELSDILYTIESQSVMDPVVLMDRFWDMFVVDAWIGNWDRHNGNWGFLYNTFTDEVQLAPVFDCGSSLYPQADESTMKSVMSTPRELELRIYEIPTSAILVENRKIKYFDFITSLKDEHCNRALRRIMPRIDMKVIHTIIEEMPYISDLQKEFYGFMLCERKKRILDVAMEKLSRAE